MLIILIDRWQVLSYLIRMPLLNQANHAIWQKSWSTSIVVTVFPWILEVNASKQEEKACPFSYTTPRRKKTKLFCKERASKLAVSYKGYYYNQEKWLNMWQSSWKTIETTAESSLTRFLASGASFFGREASGERRSRQRSLSGLRSSRLKVISPEVMSPETRVMSPEIYSHVARYFGSCRPNAQKDSKNARQSEMWYCETQVVRFAVVFMEIVHRKLNMKLKKLVISVTVWFLLLFLYIEVFCFERRSTLLRRTIGTLEKAAILTIARAQESSHDKQDCDVAVNSDMH